MLLLDTHAWVWSVENDTRRLGPRARRLVAAADLQERIRISPVSIFEIAALHTAGRLRLSTTVEPWMRQALASPGVRLAEVTPAVAFDAGAIPRTTLPDPLDRLIVATARNLGATLLTADSVILDYAAATGNVRVANARS